MAYAGAAQAGEARVDAVSPEVQEVCGLLYSLQLRHARTDSSEEQARLSREYEALVDRLPQEWQRVYRGRCRLVSFVTLPDDQSE
jgi:hypothetical protein